MLAKLFTKLILTKFDQIFHFLNYTSVHAYILEKKQTHLQQLFAAFFLDNYDS